MLQEIVEKVLSQSGKRDAVWLAMQSTGMGPNHPKIQICATRDAEDLTRIELGMRTVGDESDLMNPDRIYKLAQDFGGDRYLRFRIETPKPMGVDIDISFMNGNFCNDWQARPERIANEKVLLRKICQDCGIAYTTHNGRMAIVAQQPWLGYTPTDVKLIYEHILHAGKYPSISNSGRERSFHVFQFLTSDGRIRTNQGVTIGEFCPREKRPLPKESIILADEVLKTYRGFIPEETQLLYRAENQEEVSAHAGMSDYLE